MATNGLSLLRLLSSFLSRTTRASSETAVSSLVRFIDRVLWRDLFIRRYLGHGERPGRVLLVAVIVLMGTWIAYWLGGTFVLDPEAKPQITGQPGIQDALYFSLVSFTALDYGQWALEPQGWAQWIGAAESFLGIFSVVFFSVTFAQRITR